MNSKESFTTCDKPYAAGKKTNSYEVKIMSPDPFLASFPGSPGNEANPFTRERTTDQSECITRTKVYDFAVIGPALHRDVIAT